MGGTGHVSVRTAEPASSRYKHATNVFFMHVWILLVDQSLALSICTRSGRL